jgi:hypothetical protein
VSGSGCRVMPPVRRLPLLLLLILLFYGYTMPLLLLFRRSP